MTGADNDLFSVIFPRVLSSRYFFAFVAREMNCFLNRPYESDNTLVINCSLTDHIQPDALCALLCCLRKINSERPDSRVFMQFGSSSTLITYLYRTQFALLAKFGSSVLIDMIPPSIESGGVTSNTHAIRQLNYMGYLNDSIQFGCEKAWATFRSTLRGIIQKDLSAVSAKNCELFPSIQEYYNMAESFFQIAENAVEHAIAMKIKNLHVFYTFQFYQKTGLTFAICDTGSSLYRSLAKQYSSKFRNEEYGFLKKPLNYPSIFHREDFYDTNTSFGPIEKSLAAILETVGYRIGEKRGGFGLTYVLEFFLLHNGAPKTTVSIHSGQASVVFTESLLERLFNIERTSEVRSIESINKMNCLAFFSNWRYEESVLSCSEPYVGTQICVRIPSGKRTVSNT